MLYQSDVNYIISLFKERKKGTIAMTDQENDLSAILYNTRRYWS